MEAGVIYNKEKLHKVGYFRELLANNPDINGGLRSLLRLCRETVVRLGKTESALVRTLQHDSLLAERVERLMTIPAVGPITALTWALEVGEVKRFSSIKKAINPLGCEVLTRQQTKRAWLRLNWRGSLHTSTFTIR
jgi:transposase